MVLTNAPRSFPRVGENGRKEQRAASSKGPSYHQVGNAALL